MPSDQGNSTMANATGSFLTIRSNYSVCASWTYLCLPLCPVSLLYYSGGVDLQLRMNGSNCIMEIVVIFAPRSSIHTLWICWSNYPFVRNDG